jgi:hypothetical protein
MNYHVIPLQPTEFIDIINMVCYNTKYSEVGGKRPGLWI